MLLAMMRLDSRAYGVLIVLEMEKQTGCSIAPSAVCVTLRRLEKRVLLTSSMVPTRRALSVDPVSMLKSD